VGWSAGVTWTNRLDVFTEKEAELFLDAYGIVDPKRRSPVDKLGSLVDAKTSKPCETPRFVPPPFDITC